MPRLLTPQPPNDDQTKAHAWGAALNRTNIEFELSEAASAEALAFIEESSLSVPVGSVAVAAELLPRLELELQLCRECLDQHQRVVLLRPLPGADFHQRRHFAWLVACLLGEPLVQNREGDRLISVYARPGGKRVVDGARYHQSREGGGPHTDNVSIPEPWDYLVFACARAARLGGESILINALAVHRELESMPAALEILRRPFWWEYRGISDSLYQAPIVTYSASGEPHFRYLRRYLESAHARAGEALTLEQVWSLDVLDAILELSTLQFRTFMREGEILITYDSQVFHARTSFADDVAGGAADVSLASSLGVRFFDRMWVRKRPPAAPTGLPTHNRT
jgi:hypothetical protein